MVYNFTLMKNFCPYILLTRCFNAVFLLSLFFCTITVNGQSIRDFTDVLSTRIIGKKMTKKVGKDISERTFLGVVKDVNGKTTYAVVIEFLRIQAAIVYHGHSNILFFDRRNKLVKIAALSLNNELPFKLEKNVLYFNYTVNNKHKIFQQLIQPLPKMICVGDGCYDVQSP